MAEGKDFFFFFFKQSYHQVKVKMLTDSVSFIVESQEGISKSRKTPQRVRDQQERAAAGQVKGTDTKHSAPRT